MALDKKTALSHGRSGSPPRMAAGGWGGRGGGGRGRGGRGSPGASPPPRPRPQTPFLVGLDAELVRMATGKGNGGGGGSAGERKGAKVVGPDAGEVWGVASSESCMVPAGAEVRECRGCRARGRVPGVLDFPVGQMHPVGSTYGVAEVHYVSAGYKPDQVEEKVSEARVCGNFEVLHFVSPMLHFLVVHARPLLVCVAAFGRIRRCVRVPHLNSLVPRVRWVSEQAGSSGVATTQPSSTLLEVVRRMLKQVRAALPSLLGQINAICSSLFACPVRLSWVVWCARFAATPRGPSQPANPRQSLSVKGSTRRVFIDPATPHRIQILHEGLPWVCSQP